jgi:hypothetical protein
MTRRVGSRTTTTANKPAPKLAGIEFIDENGGGPAHYER